MSTRLNPEELVQLDALRAKVGMQRGEYMRAATFDRLPPSVPPINLEAAIELRGLASQQHKPVPTHD